MKVEVSRCRAAERIDQRIETAVPLGEPDFIGTVHSDIKPIIGIWF